MLESVLPAAIAAFASIAVIVYTQYQNKQLTFFQTYFTKKLEAYSAFWAAMWKARNTFSTEANNELIKNFQAMGFFVPEKIYEDAMKIVLSATDKDIDTQQFGESIEALMDAMRNDLENCQRMKFGLGSLNSIQKKFFHR